jgi:hypothetical protein
MRAGVPARRQRGEGAALAVGVARRRGCVGVGQAAVLRDPQLGAPEQLLALFPALGVGKLGISRALCLLSPRPSLSDWQGQVARVIRARVRGGITGVPKCRNVGESQALRAMINPIIPLRNAGGAGRDSHPAAAAHGDAVPRAPAARGLSQLRPPRRVPVSRAFFGFDAVHSD